MKRILTCVLLACIPYALHAQNNPCEFLSKETDKFTGETDVSTPMLKPLRLIKSTKGKVTRYYLRLLTRGATAVSSSHGVTILMANGKRIVKPKEEIDSDVSDGSFEYTAMITLTPADIALLKVTPITDFRLYIFDEEIPAEDRAWYLGMFRCIFAN